MRHFAILPLLLALTACWTSKAGFYTPDPKLPAPFTSGRYAPMSQPANVVRMTRLADGRFEVAQEGRPAQVSPVTFQPLTIPGRRIWIMQVPFDISPRLKPAVYELIEQKADGAIVMAERNCAGSEATTRRAGGKVESQPNFNNGRPSCVFATRAGLESAVAAYARTRNPLTGETVRRIGG